MTFWRGGRQALRQHAVLQLGCQVQFSGVRSRITEHPVGQAMVEHRLARDFTFRVNLELEIWYGFGSGCAEVNQHSLPKAKMGSGLRLTDLAI
jgi:hypothetical protein